MAKWLVVQMILFNSVYAGAVGVDNNTPRPVGVRLESKELNIETISEGKVSDFINLSVANLITFDDEKQLIRLEVRTDDFEDAGVPITLCPVPCFGVPVVADYSSHSVAEYRKIKSLLLGALNPQTRASIGYSDIQNAEVLLQSPFDVIQDRCRIQTREVQMLALKIHAQDTDLVFLQFASVPWFFMPHEEQVIENCSATDTRQAFVYRRAKK